MAIHMPVAFDSQMAIRKPQACVKINHQASYSCVLCLSVLYGKPQRKRDGADFLGAFSLGELAVDMAHQHAFPAA